MSAITTTLSVHDDEIVRRAAQNLIDYKTGKRRTDVAGVSIYVEYAGVFSVNMEELLEVIERLTRPAGPPVTDADRVTGLGWPA